ncbi:MAG TPA: NAD-glutamate dehydrogenase [Asticcacaulis sp.]|nr:NAD-glutamate dehydrogenase [Asticcacaulis sp.]
MDEHTPKAANDREALSRGFAQRLGARDWLRLGEAEKGFLSQILEDYDPDELPDVDLTDMEAVIADAWSYGERREGGRTNRRIQTLSGYDVIEIVQADSPFIVETVMGELIDQGASIRSMFHPLVTVRRDAQGLRLTDGGEAVRESMMLVFIDRQPPERHAAILHGLDDSLNDLKLAVHDFPRMQALMTQEIAALEALKTHPSVHLDPEVIEENLAFLRWIDANHFVFLGAKGYTYPRNADGSYARQEPLSQLQEGYGVLRDASRQVLRRTSEPAVLSDQILNQLENSEPVTVAKANLKSRVHRRVYMDYVGVKRYGADGRPSGELRFVGLFTSEAYDRPALEVPLARRKCRHVLHEAAALGLQGGYNENRLKNILETYPRDELFQMSEADLLRIARGVLHLADRPRVKLFARNDPFDRFVSVLLYIPREVWQAQMQKQAGEILARAYGGRVSASYPYISESLLSCVHYIVGFTPGEHLDPAIADIEAQIEDMTRSWPQKVLAHALNAKAEAGIDWLDWARAFPASYPARYDVDEALLDIAQLAALSEAEPLAVRAYRREGDADNIFRYKLYTRAERAIALSDILPVLDNMGVKTLEEYGHAVRAPELGVYWVHEFILRAPKAHILGFDAFREVFEATLMALRHGLIEDDGFNALALAGIGWREVALLRALARYRVQSGLDPSPDIQQAALRDNPDVTRALLELFRVKFDPMREQDRDERIDWARAGVDDLLQAVASLDHDRVLRRLAAVISAARRTNFYQTDESGQPKPYISIKIASRELADLPEPKPYREIFVWAPHVEGVHLRFGPVARGGLRWSDRREDFRTEVLGLVKAQQVKNAVIVPVGSKGGFYPKKLPRDGGPDAVREEAVRAYKTFLRGLLDLTDTIDPSGRVVPPPQVVRHEGDDPYLVVAADKGTATFSDIANGVSAEYGFWLGDAFASGGSVGYDHKAMGITARGAWEAVKRHFRELGPNLSKDIQSETFTVAGVGDMSGDVFGNGMLLSEQTKLVAAFDHRDIFIDPNPDPAVSFKERQRMFALPRSSWRDYNADLISKGGGVFSRSQKSIPLSAEIRALLDLDAEAVTPFELMQAILKMRVELLYFGGIGAYIKAASQSHLDVGDKANDAIRINGDEVRALVIGEGANLGVTQAGRIACAEAGVRLNTDAIDNSAGVDCSDHEVNIKILLGSLIASGELKAEDRAALLASMTDDVAQHVLRHNYDQTLALSLQEMRAVEDNEATEAFMSGLEKRGRLDRKVEGLPSGAQMAARRAQGLGLYRPELAVATAYAKLTLFDDMIASTAPDDPAFIDVLTDYFPAALHGYGRAIREHRLHREIIATVLANEIVNMTGASFASRLMRGAGVDAGGLVLAFEATRRLFGVKALWAQIDALDNKIPASEQLRLYARLARFVRHQTWWMARRFAGGALSLDAMVAPYAEGLQSLMTADGDVATRLAELEGLHHAPDIIDLAQMRGKPLDKTRALYELTGARFGFDSLREGAGALSSADPWDRLATRRLIEDVLAEQKTVVKTMMARMSLHDQPQDIIAAWEADNADLIEPLRAMMADMQTGGWSFAKLSIVNARLREWAGRL